MIRTMRFAAVVFFAVFALAACVPKSASDVCPKGAAAMSYSLDSPADPISSGDTQDFAVIPDVNVFHVYVIKGRPAVITSIKAGPDDGHLVSYGNWPKGIIAKDIRFKMRNGSKVHVVYVCGRSKPS